MVVLIMGGIVISYCIFNVLPTSDFAPIFKSHVRRPKVNHDNKLAPFN